MRLHFPDVYQTPWTIKKAPASLANTADVYFYEDKNVPAILLLCLLFTPTSDILPSSGLSEKQKVLQVLLTL